MPLRVPRIDVTTVASTCRFSRVQNVPQRIRGLARVVLAHQAAVKLASCLSAELQHRPNAASHREAFGELLRQTQSSALLFVFDHYLAVWRAYLRARFVRC